MRVLTVSPMPPKRDGIATYTCDLSAALRAEGHTVGHVTMAADQSPADRVAVLSANPVSVRGVVRAVRGWSPDVVHVQHAIATYGPHLPSVLALLWALRRRNVDVLVTHHEVTRDTDRLGPLGRAYYRLVSRLADRLHVHTEGAADRLDACGVDRSRVVVSPHPVFRPRSQHLDEARVQRLRREHARSRRHVLLLIGYIQVEKGHLEAVEAVGRLLQHRPGLREDLALVIAGEVRGRPKGFESFERADRDYAARVRARVRELALEDVVTWTGHVSDEDFVPWFHAADLVLLPYRAAEESGIAGHAIAAGTPVLASAVGGLRSLFGGTALELPAREPDPFADALAEALDDPARLRAETVAVHERLTDTRDPRRLARIVTQTRPAQAHARPAPGGAL